MDGKVVVGVGNIYANEALLISGIRPDRAAGRVSAARYQRLAENIKQVLTSAIEQGGTTLRDFVGVTAGPDTSPNDFWFMGERVNLASVARLR